MDKLKVSRSLSLIWDSEWLHPYKSLATRKDGSVGSYAPLGSAKRNTAADVAPSSVSTNDTTNGGATESKEEMASVDAFFGKVSHVQTSLRELDEKLDQLRALHAESLSSLSYAKTDSGAAAGVEEVDAVTGDLQMRTNELRNDLSELGSMAGTDQGRRAHFDRLKAGLTRFVEEWTRVESVQRERVRDRVARQVRIVRPDATEQDVRDVLETGETSVFEAAMVSGNRSEEARQALGEAQARRDQLKRMEQTIVELSLLMQQVAELVVSHDTKFDSVENNASKAEFELESGLAELKLAKVSAAAARHKRKICAMCFLIVVVTVIVVVVVQFKGTSSSSKDQAPEPTTTSPPGLL